MPKSLTALTGLVTSKSLGHAMPPGPVNDAPEAPPQCVITLVVNGASVQITDDLANEVNWPLGSTQTFNKA